MKNFFRTVGGKILVFAVCIISTAVFAVSCMATVAMLEFRVYSDSEETTFERVVENQVRTDSYHYICNYKGADYRLPGANLALTIYDEDGAVLSKTNGNAAPGSSYKTYRSYYGEYEYTDGGTYTEIEMISGPNEPAEVLSEGQNPDPVAVYTVEAKLNTNFPADDLYRLESDAFHLLYRLKYAIYPIAFITFALMIISFILLMNTAGKGPDREEIELGLLGFIPFDVLIAVTIGLVVLSALVIDFGFEEFAESFIPVGIFFFLAWMCMGLGLCISFAARVKQKTLLRKSLIGMICILLFRFIRGIFTGIGKILSQIPVIWKTVLFCGLYFLINIIFIAGIYSRSSLAFLYFLVWAAFSAVLCYCATVLARLRRATEALASGNLEYQIDESGMVLDFRETAESLNHIREGIASAVEEQTKSERMKTVLITNVSHDIKTPLTSIINYSDLISREQSENEKITEYAGVLNKQSVKLKRLIEDLVEASKASTGTLDVELMACDASLFITQALGEYADKLENARLTLVTRQPEDEVRIMADGRRMWRIFDNLMNNICKYAQEGTRVYLNLAKENGNAVITLKNTSRDELNITEEELMERFVRGDDSRHTEGNGLGLSIAKSLAELQGGKLEVKIDGDLFKAILTFPLIA